jgi:peptidoglycan/LPS O-acetylase OafA/YrhL
VRALAALYVVCAHGVCFSTGVVVRTGLVGLLTNWTLYGHLAVDAFIVLSGFCLMLPPLYVAMLLCLALKIVGDRLGMVPNNVTWTSLLLNVLLLQDVFPEANVVNAVFWSVALEFKIYLFFPLLLAVQRRWGNPATLAVGAALGYGLTGLYRVLRPDVVLNHSCPWYVLLFTMGMCGAAVAFSPVLARQQQQQRWRWAWGGAQASFCLAAFGLFRAFPMVTGSGDVPYFAAGAPLIDPVVGAAFTAFLVLVGRGFHVSGGVLTAPLRWLSARPLVFIGTLSYSLYLIHQPFVHLISDLQQHFLGSRLPLLAVNAPLGALLYFGFMLPTVLGAAYLFFLLFERPFLSAPPRKPAAAAVDVQHTNVASA